MDLQLSTGKGCRVAGNKYKWLKLNLGTGNSGKQNASYVRRAKTVMGIFDACQSLEMEFFGCLCKTVNFKKSQQKGLSFVQCDLSFCPIDRGGNVWPETDRSRHGPDYNGSKKVH